MVKPSCFEVSYADTPQSCGGSAIARPHPPGSRRAPASLIESELFDYVRGAFTGATSAKAGRCELVDGGTIYLGEIGEMEMELQAKLLR